MYVFIRGAETDMRPVIKVKFVRQLTDRRALTNEGFGLARTTRLILFAKP